MLTKISRYKTIGAHADDHLGGGSRVSNVTGYEDNLHGVVLNLELEISYFHFRFRVAVVVQNQTACPLLCKLDCADYQFDLADAILQHKIKLFTRLVRFLEKNQ